VLDRLDGALLEDALSPPPSLPPSLPLTLSPSRTHTALSLSHTLTLTLSHSHTHTLTLSQAHRLDGALLEDARQVARVRRDRRQRLRLFPTRERE